MEPWAIFDGRCRPLAEVTVAELPHLLVGAGFFETMRVDAGVVLRLEAHLARLRASLAAVAAVQSPRAELLEAPTLRRSIGEAVDRGLVAPDTAARLTVVSGHTLVTFRPLPSDEGPAVIEGIDASTYRHGDVWPNRKSLSYLRSYAAAGTPVLFANERGELCEAPTANVFVLHAGALVTPPLDAPCLPGITRGALLAAGTLTVPERGSLPVRESALAVGDLAAAEGIILTSALRLAQPVGTIFGRALPRSAELARAAYGALCRSTGA